MVLDANAVILYDGNSNAPLLGQGGMAGSIPVTIASDQSTFPVDVGTLPLPPDAATETTLTAVAGSVGSIDAKLNSLGQKTMANSAPIVIASDQSAIPVSGSFSSASVGATGAAVPASADYVGFLDASGNLQGARVFDGDTGAGSQWNIGVMFRKPASGGTVDFGTFSDPVVVDIGRVATAALTLGQKTMANSLPVAIASDQSGSIFSAAGLPATLPTNVVQVGGRQVSNNVMSAFKMFDLDTSGTDEFNLGVQLRLPGAGGSIAAQGQQTSANSLPVVLASDQSAPADLSTSGSLNALAATVVLAIPGRLGASVTLGSGGTLIGTVVFEASVDNQVNYDTVWVVDTQNSEMFTQFVSASGDPSKRMTFVLPPGVTHVRVRVSAFTSGARTFLLRATQVPGQLAAMIPVPGTLANGTQTTVDNTGGGVSILGANVNRKKMIIQNVGSANMRVGVTGVTTTTGVRLVPGAIWEETAPYCPTAAIFAIREGATNTTALAMEIT